MTRIRPIAMVLLLLLWGQMGAAVIASAARCCPAMSGSDAPAMPCASLSALGCCEAKAQAPLPERPVPPVAAAVSPGLVAFAAAPAPLRSAPPTVPVAAERALRHTILRL